MSVFRVLTAPLVIVAGLGVAGCENMTQGQERLATGAAVGGATGALASGVTGGDALTGGLVGGALGAGAGYLYDRYDEGRLD